MRRLFLTIALVVTSVTAWPATFTVTSSADSGTSSFRGAIMAANADPDFDTIVFEMAPGPQTITIISPLPALSGPVSIDGATQPGYSGSPIVRLDGNNAGGDGLLISAGAENTLVNGLIFTRFSGDGLDVRANNVNITNCYFGTNGVTALPNLGNGVHVNASITGIEGIAITSSTLSGNGGYGLRLKNSHFVSLTGSRVGVSSSSVTALPNASGGVLIEDCHDVAIGLRTMPPNIVASNGGPGVRISSGLQNRVNNTLLYNNADLGIDLGPLGVTENDLDDEDEGANNLQNFPILAGATRYETTCAISGLFEGPRNSTFVIEIFATQTPDPSGHGEGRIALVSEQLNVDNDGLAPFSYTVPLSLLNGATSISATLTDPFGNTSEFGPNVALSDEPPFTGFEEVFSDPSPATSPGWNKSGIDSGPEFPFDPTSPDDAATHRGESALEAIVRPSTGRYRIIGWAKYDVLPFDNVGSENFVRGKFYLYTSAPPTALVNEVPNFRLRLDASGAMAATVNFSHAGTGVGGAPHEPLYDLYNNPDIDSRIGPSIRPSSDPVLPSLYRVDFDPVDVPALAGTNVGALFETYSTENPASASLCLSELSVALYPKLNSADGELIFNYERLLGPAGGAGGPKTFAPGAINIEADFQAGRRQKLFLPAPLGTTPANQLADALLTEGGITVDTLETPANLFGVGIFSMFSTFNDQAPRISPEKLYMARYYVTSDQLTSTSNPAATIQSSIRLRIQTALGGVSSLLELGGPQNANNPDSPTKTIGQQILPGTHCANPDTDLQWSFTGEAGGWYTVLLRSPLSLDIRSDYGAYGPLMNEPGPGSSFASGRDISFGADLIEQPSSLRFGPDFVLDNFAQPNRGKIRVTKMTLTEFDDINDSGYLPGVDLP